MQEFVTEKTELHQKLFDEMLNRFNLSARDIASTSGISEVMISRFRHGRADLGTAKFLALIGAIPEEAKDWYISQLLGAKPKINLRSLIAQAPIQEQAEALHLIAEIFATVSRINTDITELPKAM
ncbi:MAG: XRE family transcriptional regulator [Calothrix sp. CSU_2_0]|jgi:transcriptional regulator with XRE-family HTH domain|nr:XRE family transcriptional regulator [Calothrix sp. CSU_2_0]